MKTRRVDQAGNDRLAGAVDDGGAFRRALVQRGLAGGDDLLAVDDDGADLVDAARRIDDAGALRRP